MKALTAHISCADFATVDDVKGCAGNAVCEVVEALGDQISELGIKSRENIAHPKCLSIMVADKIIAAGLALLVPMMSLAT